MTHKFKVSGMSCNHCVKRVQKTLSEVKGVEKVTVTLDPAEAEISMNQPADITLFNSALEKAGDYRIVDEISA